MKKLVAFTTTLVAESSDRHTMNEFSCFGRHKVSNFTKVRKVKIYNIRPFFIVITIKEYVVDQLYRLRTCSVFEIL